MKHIKTLTAVAAVVCCAAITSQAAFVTVAGFGPGSATMATGAGSSTVGVDYEVLQDSTSSIYYYLYQVKPVGTGGIESFQVTVNPAVANPTILSSAFIGITLATSDIIAGGTIDPGWTPAAVVTAANVRWSTTAFLQDGKQSIVLGFSSLLGPTWGNGQAADSVPPSPWDTVTGGTFIPVPVPEPTTMIAGAMLLLPFAASTLRMVRKNRTA
jgi:hypothetical protein